MTTLLKQAISISKVLAQADQCSDDWNIDVKDLAKLIEKDYKASLQQLLFHGPVYDGNVISKTRRDDLITLGLAVRVCFKGTQGFTAATYLAFSVNEYWK